MCVCVVCVGCVCWVCVCCVLCVGCLCVGVVCVCVCRRLCVLLKIIVPGVFTAEVGKGGVWREAEGLKPPLDAVGPNRGFETFHL